MMRVTVLAAVIAMTVHLSVGQSLDFFPAQSEALPADAAAIVDAFERHSVEARARATDAIEAERRDTILKLDELARRCDATGRTADAAAIRRRIASLRADATPPTPAFNLLSYRGQHGKVLTLTVTGRDHGNVWGDGVYTDDSDLATAAVHAGVLAVGQTGPVTVTVLPGQETYPASTRHGITSRAYGAWQGGYHVARPLMDAPRLDDMPLATPSLNLRAYRDRVGERIAVTVTGAAPGRGSIWGDGAYTDDSNLAVAAVHAGALAVGESATVDVIIMPGQPAYPGSTRHGVTSMSYGPWGGSYRVERADR